VRSSRTGGLAYDFQSLAGAAAIAAESTKAHESIEAAGS
jgi:hypothetical protein